MLRELEAQRRRRPGGIRALVAPRVLTLAVWLERLGRSMAAEPAPQE